MARRQDVEASWTALLVAVGQGSRAALKVLYATSSPYLHAVVRRVQPDRAEAEDVLQEVYIKVWMHADSYDPGKSAAAAWLHGVAQHAALDNLRRARSRPLVRRQLGEEVDDPYVDLHCTSPAPPEQLLERQSSRALRQSLARLPADAREVVMLAYDHGLSHSETATRMGRPLGTVKSLLRRSLRALRPTLAAWR